MSSQDRLQQHRALNPKQSGIGRTSNSGIAGTNLVNLDPDDTIISSASQVRPDKTTSASPVRQTSESDRETPDESQRRFRILSQTGRTSPIAGPWSVSPVPRSWPVAALVGPSSSTAIPISMSDLNHD